MNASPDEDRVERLRAELAPDFEILRLLGSGKMSHVFLAREPALQRLVAIKVLRSSIGEEEAVRARFEREGRAQAGISSRNVPSVHRVGRLESGVPYIILEYLEGRTLADELAALGAKKPAEARTILADVATALAAAHAKGIVHRDVRPENVMIRKADGRAMLMDFGLAGLLESGSQASMRLTRTGEILGNPHYISPEQLRGAVVTVESDVYSLGLLGYELLTCENPFGSKSSQDLIAGHLEREPIELPWAAIGNDGALADLLRRCLDKEPARRPRAEELAAGLVGEGGASPSAAQDSGPLQDFPRLAGFVSELKRRRVYQVGAAYVVGMAVVIGPVSDTLGGLGAPEWVMTSVTVALLLGLPVALALSWVYDITSSGVRKTAPSEPGSPRTSLGFKLGGLAVSVALAALVGWLLLR